MMTIIDHEEIIRISILTKILILQCSLYAHNFFLLKILVLEYFAMFCSLFKFTSFFQIFLIILVSKYKEDSD